MNQEKIGKFILECRKKKNMTQSELAEKLGVSDRTVGNWENGRNMPDLSLFKPLCEELEISINELLSGEKLKEEVYQEKLEENIINTIDYSTKRIRITNNTLGIALIAFGIVLTIAAFSMVSSDSSWGSFYSVVGSIIMLLGVYKLIKKFSYIKKLLIIIVIFILYMSVLLTIDYIGSVQLKQLPRFCYEKIAGENVYECKNIFYNAFLVNGNEKNAYVVIDKDKKYTTETVPNVPFNRNKSGIDNIINYKNKYVGNNSNTGNLISSLPLSEYGYVFEIDSNDLGVVINYHITDWYINENQYLEKCLIYNSVSMFSLIDNLEYIKFVFSGKTYTVNRINLEEKYPHFADINTDIENNFNKYLEEKINDDDFINLHFKNIFIEG